MKQREKNESKSLTEEMTAILRSRILHGEYAIGEKLTEIAIAEELQVSRTPIRDALRQLEKEQLVEYVPHKGCFARGFGVEDVEDIYAVRAALEELAIRRAIQNAEEQDIELLGNKLEQMWYATNQKSYGDLLQGNDSFHKIIYRMTGSRFIVQTMRTYQEYIHRTRQETLRSVKDLPEIYREHRMIYQALAARDEEAAVAALKRHLKNCVDRVKQQWGSCDG